MNKKELLNETFKEDMKRMYEIKGKQLIMNFLTIFIVSMFFLFMIKEPYGLEWTRIGMIGFGIITFLVLEYLVIYATKYMVEFQEQRKHSDMLKKYSFMNSRFSRK